MYSATFVAYDLDLLFSFLEVKDLNQDLFGRLNVVISQTVTDGGNTTITNT